MTMRSEAKLPHGYRAIFTCSDQGQLGCESLELILLPSEGEWYTLHVGKNRSGPGNRQIGRVRYSSIDVGDVSAAVVAEMMPDESTAATSPERKQGKNQTLLLTLFQRLVFEVREFRQPYGHDGPRVKAVGKDDLREAFRKRKAGAATTIRKGFDAALSHFLETGVIVQQEDGAGTWLWFASKDDEQGKNTEIDEEAA